jgi:hypothetical protein
MRSVQPCSTHLVLFVITIITMMTTQVAWADDVSTTWSCSMAKAQKTCTFDIDIRGEITPSTLEDLKNALAERRGIMSREGDAHLWLEGIDIDSKGGMCKQLLISGGFCEQRMHL